MNNTINDINKNINQDKKFVVKKSMNLRGRVYIDGSKNACLPIIASSILFSGEDITINRVPFLSDVLIMCELLEELGVNITKDEEHKQVKINTKNIKNKEVSYELVKKIRASFLLAGPLLSRFKKAVIQMPGGCPIGVRPIDLHLKGFKLLGATIKQEHGVITMEAKEGLKGAEIYLDFPSVGATENLIMAGVLAEGTTIISNCAIEPEIVDLIEFLINLGAKIEGAGTETIIIHGVEELKNFNYKHEVIPDRIEAGTFLVLGAVTKSEIEVCDINKEHLKPIISKLREINIELEEKETSIKVLNNNLDDNFKNVDIKTMPYPGFPTDMQPQFMTLLCISDGTGVVNETIFENRFMHISELCLMGANIKIKSNTAIVKGVDKLTGAKVKATDLRAGAGLIIGGLVAEGKTEISDIYHIERGYYKIEDKLKELGANIYKI
ncbi:MAG: UDP-N-acetylglucosamine 1-carboxyvinyltransferase [bacterium]